MKNKKDLEILLENFKERGIFSDCTSIENFLKLDENERTLYWGIDCTSDSLHIGHLSILLQLFKLSENGFKIIFILGGSTSTIGDPSDKLKERPILEKDVIKRNRLMIEKQLKEISDRKTENLSFEKKPLSNFYSEEKTKEIYNCVGIEESSEKEV